MSQYSTSKDFNENAAWTNETKYLGVITDPKLTHKAHTSFILRKANCILRQLFPVLNKSSNNDANLALILHKSLHRSILTHASWGYAVDTYINKLHTFQNKYLKIITKLRTVPPIKTFHEQTGMSLIKHHNIQLGDHELASGD
jgi:hypothetical protein